MSFRFSEFLRSVLPEIEQERYMRPSPDGCPPCTGSCNQGRDCPKAAARASAAAGSATTPRTGDRSAIG
jgi:hypothetical protein